MSVKSAVHHKNLKKGTLPGDNWNVGKELIVMTEMSTLLASYPDFFIRPEAGFAEHF